MSYERGEIYYVQRGYCFGSEQHSGRPAIIVSSDVSNWYSNTVEVVYLTTRPKKAMPVHVHIEATGRPSTALCEQVHTVDARRLGHQYGRCSQAEMQEIDKALKVSLGLVEKRCLLCGATL